MAFQPDIIVSGPEPSEISMVVEVKTFSRSIDDAERQLKSYMAAVRAPVGLLVTPEQLRIYRDRYLPSSDDSIAKVGEFNLENLLVFEESGSAKADALGFERQVQSWLETLSTDSGIGDLPSELRKAAEMYIIPALTHGSVRSGHPRLPITA